ncbi:MAG: TetR/AcrR family transcriptional regulator [Rhodospirillaceae bacterium]|nr:TetR/AcrR family transcriptional regulator [Rhodospirillaceae bacterium]MBT4464705.1 TetR/AcrR family transcriptional regulator [Rhodospirillaceae bacterium]MBT5013713.1 TetR/AcrR family transcriptional regulator [Rhodospirillaceae bacterium]MBT5308933.1 TetR/AcrR family transcriptional regulator [Rhodospirillaceae bacterium]MBT6407646.1 TetR/AcrR family transcriptional regulator [Rhodospirillaceae bacterium]
MTSKCTAKAAPSKRKRMSPEERETLIVDEAICFFAEHGFEGKTRDLAKRLGITQPLLYRYFPSKESLIERVYQEVYVQRWNPDWDDLIPDRSRPLADRLAAFYKEYARAVYDYVWVRIFLYSGLKGVDINDRYLGIIKDKVLIPVCTEMRHEYKLPSPDKTPIEAEELELAWGLHGMFFYRAVRHFAYSLPVAEDIDQAIENDVSMFLAGAPKVHKRIVKKAAG